MTYTTYVPSTSTPSDVRPDANDKPISQPSGMLGNTVDGSPPSNGTAERWPRSAPVVSCHQAIRPSGRTQDASTPIGSALAWRHDPSARSWAHACDEPLRLAMTASLLGAVSHHDGKPSFVAVKRKAHDGAVWTVIRRTLSRTG